MKKELSPKQQKFCYEYIKDFNATQAYIRAGYSPNGAKQSGHRLLTYVYLQKYLTEQTNKQTEKAELSIKWVIKELKEIHRRCTEGRLEVNGATRSLEMLGKYLGMWIERSELTINIKEIKTIVIQIQTIISRHITDPNVKNRIAEDLKMLGL